MLKKFICLIKKKNFRISVGQYGDAHIITPYIGMRKGLKKKYKGLEIECSLLVV